MDRILTCTRALRDELCLGKGAVDLNGAPTWRLRDPVAGATYVLSQAEIDELSSSVSDAFAERLSAACLTQAIGDDASRRITATNNRFRINLAFFAKTYLFLKIPFGPPGRLTQAIAAILSPLFGFWGQFLFAILAMVSFTLAMRVWETIFANTITAATPTSAAIAGAAFILAKLLHECGHLAAAYRVGVRAKDLGVAFVVLLPILYTDFGDDAYRVSRRERISINLGGVYIEAWIAIGALLCWHLIAPGAIRDAIALFAIASLLATLFINLNPLMRFDGYYLLADASGIDNLQARAFAFSRWALRERILGLGERPPISAMRRTRICLATYGYCIWAYRFFLYLTIAFLVYELAFKALGIILFLLEIYYFIGSPILREVAAYWRKRSETVFNRNIAASFGFVLALLVVLFFPWFSKFSAPAIVTSEREAVVEAPITGRIKKVSFPDGGAVKKGEVLFIIEGHGAALEVSTALAATHLLELKLQRSTLEARSARETATLQAEHRAAMERVEAARAKKRVLVYAAFDGTITPAPLTLNADDPVAKGAELASIRGGNALLTAYFSNAALDVVAIGGEAEFIPEDVGGFRRTGVISVVPRLPATSLAFPSLASASGGEIEAWEDKNGAWRPKKTLTPAKISPVLPASRPAWNQRGRVFVDRKEPVSIFDLVSARVEVFMAKEFGFSGKVE